MKRLCTPAVELLEIVNVIEGLFLILTKSGFVVINCVRVARLVNEFKSVCLS